jgi:hypothetical protein
MHAECALAAGHPASRCNASRGLEEAYLQPTRFLRSQVPARPGLPFHTRPEGQANQTGPCLGAHFWPNGVLYRMPRQFGLLQRVTVSSVQQGQGEQAAGNKGAPC